MTYKELIEKNIKEFEEFEDFPENLNWIEYIKEVRNWHINSLISYLEEENKRLKGQNKWTQSDLKSPFGHSEDKGYNQAKQEEINHNLEIISYLKKL